MNLKIYFNQIILVLLISALSFSQQINQSKQQIHSPQFPLLNQKDIVKLSPELQSKVLSGKLIQSISQKIKSVQNSISSTELNMEQVVIYVSKYPTPADITALEEKRVKCYLDLWTPPMENHPYGFFIAEMPISELHRVLSFGFIKKMDTAEYQSYPQNNTAAISINSDDVWLGGHEGTGVKVAVLDSGLDDFYDGTDLPASYSKKDYSEYPTLDDGVENTVTGHGTHVAGSVLGRGILSTGRIDDDNGSSAFKGSAPDADLIFLKIGSDASGSASSVAMIAAMDAAVNTYSADVLTMSYGGWYTYHDGSSATEQKVDWVYSQGVPFFLSAGNSGNDDQHYSGTVGGNSETGYIEINADAGAKLSFNLVWYDGLGTTNDLFLEYYRSNRSKISSNITQYATTESTRGTKSKYSWYNPTVGGTYYVKVVNNSSNSQFFHIYFYRQTTPVLSFVNADPEYTIGQPASADNGFAVGAWVSRSGWRASDGTGMWGYGYTLGDIAPFSSRGPRIDGGATKPNIAAPGSAILSLRDSDVYTTASAYWIDNDGTTSVGDANYYSMQGTSMACPIAAGAAALLLDIIPSATPAEVYAAIQNNASTSGTGTVPNNTWGYGKLDIHAASVDSPFPVELTTFSAKEIKSKILLNWQTATEVNNYGFEIERASTPLSTSLNEENSQSLVETREWEKIGFVEGHGNSNSPKDYNFVDNNSPSGLILYRLKQIDTDGTFEYSDEIEIEVESTIENKLIGNYPNPFNPTTIIRFDLAREENVAIVVYDVIGEVVEKLVDHKMVAGRHKIEFDASRLSSGIYFYKINAGGFIDVKKMMVIK